jgi:hypothetical protein
MVAIKTGGEFRERTNGGKLWEFASECFVIGYGSARDGRVQNEHKGNSVDINLTCDTL